MLFHCVSLFLWGCILAVVKLPKTKKSAPRDPRFDTLCGQFDNKSFKQNYKFVNNIRKEEKAQLEKEYQECTDPERKKTIKLLKQRIVSKVTIVVSVLVICKIY